MLVKEVAGKKSLECFWNGNKTIQKVAQQFFIPALIPYAFQ